MPDALSLTEWDRVLEDWTGKFRKYTVVILVQSKYKRTFPCIFTLTLVQENLQGKVRVYLL
jgi:hypothetical protein